MSGQTRWFYRAMGMVAVGLVVAGFAPALFAPVHPRAPMTLLVASHAALCIGWIALYVVQSSMVAAGRTDLHRRLGVLGAALAVALVVTGYFTAIVSARRGIAISGDPATAHDPLGALVFTLGDILSFLVLVTAALVWRRTPAVHKRLMYFATLGSMMGAPLAHLTGYFTILQGPFIVIALLLLYGAHAVYDKVATGRIHRLSLWGAVAMFVWANGRAALVGPSDTWHRFAAWLAA